MVATPARTTAEAPITAISLAILLALADEPRHGYGIIKEVERQSEGQLRIGTGSLYAALQRLCDDGLIEEAAGPAPDEDQRRKYYTITAAGRETARQELGRLARTLAIAREKRLVPEGWLPLSSLSVGEGT
jgi:DNA-binding PadR family transcriptional regulator